MTVSTGTLTTAPVILGYLFLLLLFLWCFRHELSRYTVRIPLLILVAQALMMAVSFWNPNQTEFARGLWQLHEEWNIPATFASAQLAWVGGCSLVIAFIGQSRAGVQRVYWCAIGLLFLFLGLDEYIALHESLPGWERSYAVIGAVVVSATLFMMFRVSKREKYALFGILAGLAISVAGAFVLNLIPTNCEGISFIRFRGCLQFYIWEEVLEFWGIWMVLVSVLAYLALIPIRVNSRFRNLIYSMPGIWLIILLGNSLLPRM